MTQTAHSTMPFTAVLGLEVRAAAADKVVAHADWKAERCTAGGVLHGGYLMAVADSVGALCAVLNMPPGARTATIESKTNFMRPVREGSIEVVATPVHVGRTIVVVQTDILSSGKLAGRTIQTQSVIAK
ncbi:MAG: PaaI family thioesterase [Desulfobacteraceae bacterium]|nr:MAG: PaaI family thioesterase [Desulfobacteraceae bacterium]